VASFVRYGTSRLHPTGAGYLQVLRSIAVATLAHPRFAQISEAQTEALSRVSSLLHSIDSEVMGNTGWHTEIGHAMRHLAEVFDPQPQSADPTPGSDGSSF
jgi:hypothetical protein